MDGRAERRRALRQAAGVSVPEAESRVWTAADHEPHQPGHGDRAPDHALGPAWLRGDSWRAAGDSDREIPALRAADFSPGGRWPDPRTEACGRRAPEPGGDVGNAGVRAGTLVWRLIGTAGGGR